MIGFQLRSYLVIALNIIQTTQVIVQRPFISGIIINGLRNRFLIKYLGVENRNFFIFRNNLFVLILLILMKLYTYGCFARIVPFVAVTLWIE